MGFGHERIAGVDHGGLERPGEQLGRDGRDTSGRAGRRRPRGWRPTAGAPGRRGPPAARTTPACPGTPGGRRRRARPRRCRARGRWWRPLRAAPPMTAPSPAGGAPRAGSRPGRRPRPWPAGRLRNRPPAVAAPGGRPRSALRRLGEKAIVRRPAVTRRARRPPTSAVADARWPRAGSTIGRSRRATARSAPRATRRRRWRRLARRTVRWPGAAGLPMVALAKQKAGWAP